MLAISEVTTLKQAKEISGTLGYPSKMPGTSYGIPASACKIGSILQKVAGSTCHDCYAMKANYRYRGVMKSQATRLASLRNPQWVNAMVFQLRHAHGLMTGKVARKVRAAGWHRWHDSGDVQSANHLSNICQVAALTPELSHWLPMRENGMLQSFIKQGGIIPPNLTIRVSATMIDGNATAKWATTSTVHQATVGIGHVCPAPKQGNACGDCRACWAQSVLNVSYLKH